MIAITLARSLQRAINADDERESRYWTQKFGVSAERLRAAIAAVGASPIAVGNYFYYADRSDGRRSGR